MDCLLLISIAKLAKRGKEFCTDERLKYDEWMAGRIGSCQSLRKLIPRIAIKPFAPPKNRYMLLKIWPYVPAYFDISPPHGLFWTH